MEGNKRRQEIVRQLKQANKAVSASKLADKFSVSRQIIVGDIALLRAAGEEIIATSRGYKYPQTSSLLTSKIVVQHKKEQTREELTTIVSLGGEVVDVIVEHDLYGEVVGGLYISSQKDVDNFIKNYENSNGALLLQLTNGIHMHTIRYQKESDLVAIKTELAKKGILYQN